MTGHKGWRELNVIPVDEPPTFMEKLMNRVVWGAALILIGVGLGYAWAFHNFVK